MTQHSEPKSVALLVDTSTGWGRRLARGVMSYANQHHPWDLWLEPRGQEESLRLPRGWRGDGVIARVSTRAMADHLTEIGKPVVNVSAIQTTGPDFPRVTTDTEAAVQMALDHFLDRGLRQFGYVGLPRRAYSLTRQKAFADACARSGCQCVIFNPQLPRSNTTPWERQQVALHQWLRDLAKPVGILTWGVRRGLEVITAARHEGIRIPDELAVMGSDDDELLCEAVRPSLTGLKIASEQIGHEAAAMLDQYMHHHAAPIKTIAITPTGVVARGSTDVLAMDDPDVIAAIRFIRSNANRAIHVDDVAHAVAMSRRSLERRFQKAFDRTIADEIARVHIERARQLLAESDLPIPQVAEAAGFGSPEYLATVFRRQYGITPLKYRFQVRGR